MRMYIEAETSMYGVGVDCILVKVGKKEFTITGGEYSHVFESKEDCKEYDYYARLKGLCLNEEEASDEQLLDVFRSAEEVIIHIENLQDTDNEMSGSFRITDIFLDGNEGYVIPPRKIKEVY